MKKYFVIGNPINHSLSPLLHNYWIKKNNINAEYFKKELTLNKLEEFINDIRQEKISGANITIPFKKSIIPYLDILSPEAEKSQSVNTIALKDNKLVGYNTDIFGFEQAIKKLNFSVKEKKVFILGAGGVVPSIILALKNMNASKINVSNRTKEKALDLKKRYEKIGVLNWGEIPEFDLIINATSLGLKNETINLDLSKVGHNKLFYDVIYNPSETNFLHTGKNLGNLSENGKLMFIYQALASFELWHGIVPDINEQTLALLNL
tara:strand:+ start:1905 stop:2696 length:792 start_codon:yes stop_codon:yes gene_type:complete